MKKIILIPSYEPDNKLIQLIKTIDKNEFSIIIIDDGSGKKYENIFNKIKENNDIKLLSYPVNQGKGYALKTGMKYIKENYKKDYIIITMDSDGQHKIEDAKKLADYVEKNPTTLVLGMRTRDKKVPLRSRIGNEITKGIYSLVTNLHIYDTQTGLRAFSNKLVDLFLTIDGERFEYEMNVLLQCAKRKIPIKEIKIATIYIESNKSTHFKTIKDSYRIYKEIIKFSLSSIMCFIIDYIFFVIFTICLKNIIISNILSRIISATTNYTINKKVVFNNNNPVQQSAILYFLLALLILVLNTIILNILTNYFLINSLISKIITEIILFIISYIVQKKIIFSKEKE